MDNSIVTGTFKGSLILWRGNRTTNHVEAHRGAVLAIHTRKKEIGVITGGKDGYILYWDANLKEKMRTFLGDLDITVSSLRVTAICESANGNMLAIGTRGAEIIELISGKPR
jgi:WD40 repeat protein